MPPQRSINVLLWSVLEDLHFFHDLKFHVSDLDLSYVIKEDEYESVELPDVHVEVTCFLHTVSSFSYPLIDE